MKQLILVARIAAPLGAQWLKQPTADIPRNAAGKPILTAPVPKAADGKPDLSGMWNINADTSVFRNLKADEIQPSAGALRKQRLENVNQDSPSIACLPLGPLYDYARGLDLGGMKIVQTPNLILMLNADLTYRQIFLDGRELPKDPNPAWMGFSIGHWDGDTLVVETAGFNDRTWLDLSGYPHSEAMKMTERFHRVDLGHVDLEVTFIDPVSYAKPLMVTAKMNAVFDTELLEYVCAENEKDRPHLVGKIFDDEKTVGVAVAVLAAYVGEYETEPRPGDTRPPQIAIVALKDGVLTLSQKGSINAAPLKALSETTFSFFGSPLEFVKNDRGEVTHFTLRIVEGDVRANRKK